MSISKINSHNFKREYPEIRRFSDEELMRFSSEEPDRRFRKVSKKVVNTLLFTIPAVDIAASAIVKKGALASKLKRGLMTAGIWTAAFSAGAAVQSVKKFVNSRSDYFNDFNKNHPFVATLVDFAAIFAAFTAVIQGISYLSSGVKKNFPEKLTKFNKNIKEPVKKFLNNSAFNKKLIKPAEEFVLKRPSIAKAGKISAVLLVPAMFTGVLARLLAEAKKRDENIVNNYVFLKYINNFIPDKDDIIE